MKFNLAEATKINIQDKPDLFGLSKLGIPAASLWARALRDATSILALFLVLSGRELRVTTSTQCFTQDNSERES